MENKIDDIKNEHLTMSEDHSINNIYEEAVIKNEERSTNGLEQVEGNEHQRTKIERGLLNEEFIIKDENTIDSSCLFAQQKRIHTAPAFTYVCVKQLSEMSSLTVPGKKPFSCDVCEKSFTRKSHLNEHKRTHTGEQLFSCDVCEKVFTYKQHFIAHKRIHTSEEPFSCDVCEKIFMYKSQLIVHKRIHTGEKLYSCDVCEKIFNIKSNLIQHKRLHTGVKPFTCNVCLKTFSQKSNLIRHERVHTGLTSFSCDVCERKFTYKNNLTKHQLIHTNKLNTGKISVNSVDGVQLQTKVTQMSEEHIKIEKDLNTEFIIKEEISVKEEKEEYEDIV